MSAGKAEQSSRGRPAHPEAAYLKAFLLRLRQRFPSTTQRSTFLIHYPLLVMELGFPLLLDSTLPCGFDVLHRLPGCSWLNQKLARLDRGLLTALLAGTIHAFQDEIPG